MTNRRMLSTKVVDTDAFLDMGSGAQMLYFHLVIRADDDGFVANPRKIMRMLGAQDDDYKILVAKRFILVFESGICVIKHWLIHNYIRQDRYTPTQYIKEKDLLSISKFNKRYSFNNGNEVNDIPLVARRVSQVKLNKVKLSKEHRSSKMTKEDFNTFWLAYPKKVKKKDAEKKFLKINKDQLPHLLIALEKQNKRWSMIGKVSEFIPNPPDPTTWINGARWEDEITEKSSEDIEIKRMREELANGKDYAMVISDAGGRMGIDVNDVNIKYKKYLI